MDGEEERTTVGARYRSRTRSSARRRRLAPAPRRDGELLAVPGTGSYAGSIVCERNSEQLIDTENRAIEPNSTSMHQFARVVVPAAAGSSPVTHPGSACKLAPCASPVYRGRGQRGVKIARRRGGIALYRTLELGVRGLALCDACSRDSAAVASGEETALGGSDGCGSESSARISTCVLSAVA